MINQFNLMWIVIILLIILFVYALTIFFSNNRKVSQYIAIFPSILLNIGILGTFCGICLSLYDFDVNRIDDSIVQLFKGLKTVFITSALGLSLSILLKFIFEKNKVESSNFVIEMSKAFTQAAEKIIKDFNSKLKNEFGENFKELNISIEKMLGWQKSNEKHLRTIFAQYEKTNTLFSDISSSFSEISNKSESIVAAFKLLDDSKNDFENNIMRLNSSVKEMTKWQKQHSENMSNTYKQNEKVFGRIENYQKSIETKLKSFNKITEDLRQIMEDLRQIMIVFDNTLQEIRRMRNDQEPIKKEEG